MRAIILEYLNLKLFYFIIWIKENPLLFRIIISIGYLFIYDSFFSNTDVLYCMGDNTERALEIGKEQESIISVNEKTKKYLKFYEDMLRDGRKHQEY